MKLLSVGYFEAPEHPIQPARIPEGVELLEILTGGKIYWEEDGEERVYGRGAIFWHTAGEYTIYRSVPGEYYRCLVLRFEPGPARRHIGHAGYWTELAGFEDFCRETMRLGHDETIDREVFGAMLYWKLVWEMQRSAASLNPLPPPLERALKRVEREPDRAWTVASLARAVRISESYLFSLFEKHLGTSPVRYIRDRRLHQARIDLAGSGKPIKEIARECGFGNLESFYRAFNRHCGMTPAAYRKRHAPRE